MQLRSMSIVLLMLLALLGMSCVTYYGPGYTAGSYSNMRSAIPTKKAPYTEGLALAAKYVKGSSYFGNEVNNAGELNFYGFNSGPFYDIAFGAFGFVGSYNLTYDTIPAADRGYYYYWGLGTRFKAAVNIPFSEQVSWRVIGLQGTWNFEAGNYDDFIYSDKAFAPFEVGKTSRETPPRLNPFIANLINVNLYPYTEVGFKLNDDIDMTLFGGFGYGVATSQFTGLLGASFNWKMLGIWATWQPDIGQGLLFGLYGINHNQNNGLQIGLSFKFNETTADGNTVTSSSGAI